ncbi:MAG: hypothetical protein AAGJ97_14540, partial [Planctomycetota bacterium]
MPADRANRHALTALLSGCVLAATAGAAPLESPARGSLATVCDNADAAVLMKHVDGSRWEVVASLSGGGSELVGRIADVPRLEPTDRFVVMTRESRTGLWEPPRPVSPRAATYLRGRANATAAQRIAYAARYVADGDETIRDVCCADLAAADFREVARHADRLPRARLEQQLRDGEVGPGDRRIHGILLGLCGTAETAGLCAAIASRPLEHCEIGVGDEGLWIAVALADPMTGPDRLAAAVGPGEQCQTRIRAVLDSVDWIADTCPERVGRDELVRVVVAAAMHPEGRDLAAAQLSEWRAWDAAERVVAIYGRDRGPGVDPDGDRERAGRIAMLRYLRR